MLRRINKIKTLAAALVLLSASAAHATIITGDVPGAGDFVKLSLPLGTPVGADNFQSPNLFGFDESQNTTTTGELFYDYGVGGSTGGATFAGSLAANTTVASHYVFFDPAGSSSNVSGWVEFDSKILGVISSTGLLLASDYLANTDVTYLNPGNRGLEPNQDVIEVLENRVNISFRAGTPGDYIRVLTEFSPGAAVPEPGALLLLSLGMFGLAAGKRRATARN